jgi:hypothetical protein
MSWPTWLPGFSAATVGAWLFLLLIPLVIFYFLKLKRPRMEIASLALWRQVISDQRVNSPFQKFKRNLLLLLQIIALCLIALAAMQPFLRGNVGEAQRVPILIDCSASMAARDEKTGTTRLELAKEQVRQLIADLLPGQQLTLIAVNSTAQRLTEFTDNKPVLLAALESIETTDVPSRLEEGLQLAQALTKTFSIDTVRLYSDGNLPTRPAPNGDPLAVVDFDLSFQLDFQQLPPAGANIGITAINARRASVDRWDVFVRVEGCAAVSTKAEVEMLAGGEPLGAAETVILGPGESQRLVFRVDARQPAALEVRLSPEGHDALASDNVAFLELPVGRELLAYCPIELATFRHALGQLEGILLEPDAQGAATIDTYDLVVSDRADDISREASSYFFVGVVPDDLQSLLTVELSLGEVVDWKRDEALLQHVQLRDVQITDLQKRKPGVEDGDFEELGYELLAFGSEGPLIARKRAGPKVYYYLLFHSDRSTLPYRVGFPILVQNAVNLALQQASLSELRGVTTGILPVLERLQSGQTYTVRGPDGSVLSLAASQDGRLDGVPAPAVGRYEIHRGGEPVKAYGAGLLSATETSLLGVDEIQFREMKVSAAEEKLETDKPLWSTLAMIAFSVLLGEWWLFQRKPPGLPA